MSRRMLVECDVLSCICIPVEEEVMIPVRELSFCGDFSGDEKRPSKGSIPCSSRTPASFNVIPVFLRN